jgi:hypothetical protein
MKRVTGIIIPKRYLLPTYFFKKKNKFLNHMQIPVRLCENENRINSVAFTSNPDGLKEVALSIQKELNKADVELAVKKQYVILRQTSTSNFEETFGFANVRNEIVNYKYFTFLVEGFLAISKENKSFNYANRFDNLPNSDLEKIEVLEELRLKGINEGIYSNIAFLKKLNNNFFIVDSKPMLEFVDQQALTIFYDLLQKNKDACLIADFFCESGLISSKTYDVIKQKQIEVLNHQKESFDNHLNFLDFKSNLKNQDDSIDPNDLDS